jgi:hypothetical protein
MTPGEIQDHAGVMNAALEDQRRDVLGLAGPDSLEAFEGKCHVSMKYKYFYCETPKAACSTVKLTLVRAELEDAHFSYAENRPIHMDELSPLITPMGLPGFSSRLGDLFKFCFVRDPAMRLLSAYLDKILRCRPQKRPILAALGKQDEPDYPVSFPIFVDVVCAQEPRALDPHWNIQYEQVCADRIAYDFIGKVETLDADLRSVLERLGIDKSYIFSARSHRTEARNLAATYLTPTLRRKIEERYRLDYEFFGY